MAPIDDLLKKRRTIQNKLKGFQTTMNNHATNPLSRNAAIGHLESAVKQQQDYYINEQEIRAITTDDDFDQTHQQIFDEIEEKLINFKAAFQDIIDALPPPVDPNAAPQQPVIVADNQVRLPNLQLPKFDGDITQWMSFRDLFTAAIHNNTKISDAQKLTYLKSSLIGGASHLLASMASTDANYGVAWDTLKNRFENERELVFSTLKRFMDQPSMKGECATSLRSLIDVSNACMRSLEALQIPIEHWDVIIIYIMLQKVDSSTKQFWELEMEDTKVPTLKAFLDFLEQRARAWAAGGVKSTCKTMQDARQHRGRVGANANGKVMVHHANSAECKVCSESHPLYRCQTFLSMDVPTRLTTVKKHRICFNCLASGHNASKCNSKYTCRVCKEKHNYLLHKEGNSNEQGGLVAVATASAQNFHSKNVQLGQGMLATAVVKILDQTNRPHLVRAFLDAGSTSSFMTESCVNRLGLIRTKTTASVTGLGSSNIGTTKGTVSVEVRPYFHTPGDEVFNIEMMILPSITNELPTHEHDPSGWPHLKNLQLADPEFHKPRKIDILLGSDVFWDTLLDGKKESGPGTPIAQRSKLGWLVAGHTSLKSPQILVHHVDVDVDLDQRLQLFWELESVPKTRLWKKEEKEAEKHFQSTATRNSDGIYTVSLPFKNTSSRLGASRDIAMKRFFGLERRLKLNQKHRQEYNSFMDEYLRLGHMELVNELSPAVTTMNQHETNLNTTSYYIPHHFVLKESSTTTKFRVVFDASSKSRTGVSLNDELMVGPTIQESLVSILMRFRTHVVALIADITKMYRQIRVSSPHTDFQRILWRSDPKHDVKEYRLLTVTYGTASAPFHATRVLQQLALDEQDSLPIASEMALRDFYVDDLMSGTSTTEKGIIAQQQLRELAKRGGFELRKWWSNDPEVLASIPEDLRETHNPLNLDKDDLVKTLGLHWNPGEDSFTFKVHLTPVGPGKITKRMFLSEMSKVFDPLGWIAPVTIRGKIIFQQVWKAGTGWDEALPNNIFEDWVNFRNQLPKIQNVNIPRCIKPDMTTHIGLHGFCDASEKAYAAAIYTKAYQHNGVPKISLVTAKTRVAPSNTISLPRLELCGALLLAKLMTTVQESLRLSFTEVNAWSDSTVVLAWIRGDSARWKTFVANRVTEIQENIPIQSWGHVDGTLNPADCASRGIDPGELQDHPLWWTGPEWLKNDVPEPSTTGTELGPIGLALVNEERKNVIITATARVKHDLSPLTNCSSLLKVKRYTAWWFRYLFNCRAIAVSKMTGHPPIKHMGPLKTAELDDALMCWVKIVQADEFGAEIQALTKRVTTEGVTTEEVTTEATSKFKGLNLFLDSDGILRVGGRLQNAPISADRKNPMLIPRRHRLTDLIIQEGHNLTLHGGPQLVLNMVQRRFWIPRAKDAIRYQLDRCVVCCRHRGQMMQQFMGNLPASRVTPGRAFLTCGVDYAGPFILRAIPSRSKVTFKAYLALFVCFVTHAVHLEVVSSMSTDAFMAALRRFIARRGRCRDIHSDCGTNFVGASRELKEWQTLVKSEAHNERVASDLAVEGIQWHFNPAGAPHFGGLWEAGVKSVKYHLHRVIGSARLTFEEMTTTMTQIEACLNSRPLTPVSTNPEDLTALTPGHFLIGDALLAFPEPDLTGEKINRLTRMEYNQQLVWTFWRRYTQEFLTRLQQRPKWLKHRTDCRIGDMVLIKEDNLPPLNWKLGRVVATHPGEDGLVRVATVKTANGVIKRPIVKLCLLPMDSEAQEEINVI